MQNIQQNDYGDYSAPCGIKGAEVPHDDGDRDSCFSIAVIFSENPDKV